MLLRVTEDGYSCVFFCWMAIISMKQPSSSWNSLDFFRSLLVLFCLIRLWENPADECIALWEYWNCLMMVNEWVSMYEKVRRMEDACHIEWNPRSEFSSCDCSWYHVSLFVGNSLGQLRDIEECLIFCKIFVWMDIVVFCYFDNLFIIKIEEEKNILPVQCERIFIYPPRNKKIIIF